MKMIVATTGLVPDRFDTLCAMRLTVALSGIVLSLVLQAQGHYAIGFADTLLFNDSLHYTAFAYDGPAPLIVQAWFPLDHDQASPPLTFGELRAPELRPELQRVYDELLLRMDSAFIEYNIRSTLDDEPIDYTPYDALAIKDSLFAMPTAAHRTEFPIKLDRPVIVYHHGGQGYSDENVRMAEFFAGNGFVFLSCNFHWPLERAQYGTPITWSPDRMSIRELLGLARGIGEGNKVFFIGHSWGAQIGWCNLHEPGLADAFVSLETTIEWKNDSAEVREKWPDVLDAITRHRYPMPVLMVADTEDGPPFPMFKCVRAAIRYLDPKEPFDHESYTSASFMRLAGEGRFNVPDADALRAQEAIYQALLEEMLAFFQEQMGIPVKRPVYPEGDPFMRE